MAVAVMKITSPYAHPRRYNRLLVACSEKGLLANPDTEVVAKKSFLEIHDCLTCMVEGLTHAQALQGMIETVSVHHLLLQEQLQVTLDQRPRLHVAMLLFS